MPNQIALNRTAQSLHHQAVLWDLCSSEVLCSAERKLLTDVSGQPTGPVFKGQNIQKTIHNMTEVNNFPLVDMYFLGIILDQICLAFK